MKRTAGEPDGLGQDKKTGEYLYFNCFPETITASKEQVPRR